MLITAGPTREWMDPVRYLSNPSSGAMGLSIAQAFQKKRHEVVVILGPTFIPIPKKMNVRSVQSAREMFAAVRREIKSADVFVATAAVGDWRFERVASGKIKKTGADKMRVTLVKNPDILAWASRHRKRGALVVGFALETADEKKNAVSKLRQKKLDLIVANRPDSFSTATIKPLLIDGNGTKRFPKMKKSELAARLVAWTEKKWKETKSPNS